MNEIPYFNRAPEIEELMPVAERMTKYIHDNKFGVVVSGGTSATTAAFMVKTWWQKLYQKEKTPDFLSIAELAHNEKRNPQVVRSTLVTSDFAQILKGKYPGRLNPERKIFVVEEYAFKGHIIEKIRSDLQKNGFKKIEFGTLTLQGERPERIAREAFGFVGATVAEEPKIYGARRTGLNSAIHYRSKGKDTISATLHRKAMEQIKQIRTRIRACVR